MTKREIMEDSQHCRVEYTDTDGNKHTGYVEIYETPYDNDGDEGSICIDRDDGCSLCLYESDILDIRILDDESSPE